MYRSLSLVLPAYNEAESLPDLLKKCGELSKAVSELEVIVVDDGSTDGTSELLGRAEAESQWLRVVSHPVNRGYGAALRSGFRAATKEVVAYSDSDNQFDLTDFRDYVGHLSEFEMVAGYRLNRLDPPSRLVISAFYNRLVRLLFRIPVRDVNCSFKLMRRDRLRLLELASTDFFIDTELMARAQRQGWRILEVGVRHYPRLAGQTTVKPGDVPRTLRRALAMWLALHRSSNTRASRSESFLRSVSADTHERKRASVDSRHRG